MPIVDTTLFDADDPIAWIEANFYIPETRAPLTLFPHQRLALSHALARDDDGRYRYSTVVYSDIKKSAKSTLAAAVALYIGATVDWASVYVVANDLKQADSRVGYYIRRAIELHPQLRHTAKIRNNKILFPNRATIESVPIDPTGEAGSNADLVIFSELWGAHQQAQQRMWTEMTLPPTKFGHSLRWVETYAGYTDESELLWRLYDQGVNHGRQLDEDLDIYANERLFCLWNTVPRLPWQTSEYYADEARTLTPSEFNRIHRNQWSSGSTAPFLDDPSWWSACYEDLPPLDRRTPVVIGADAGVSNDCFALVAVSRHPTRRDDVAARWVKVYEPRKGEQLDFDAIEKDLRAFIATHNVLEVAYDPYQLHQMMTKLRNSGVVKTKSFTQGGDRLIADHQLLQLIMRRGIAHGDDSYLNAHILHANRESDGEQKLRLVKRSGTLKIDAAVACSMSAFRCLKLPL